MIYFYYHPRCRENLEKGLKEDLIKNNINKSDYEKFVINYLNENRKYFKEGSGLPITINSPFINILSKAENSDLFQIDIKINNDNNLDTKYINLFSNLNQNNLAYPQIVLRIESKDIINKLKLYNINFGAIKALTIYNYISYDIYQNIFSYVNGFNNISHLDLSSKINSLEIINNFKSLKYLTLYGFKFENPFFIRLFDLIELKISSCDNIGFIEGNNTNYNLKKLEIRNSNIIIPKTIMRFSKLEDCTIYDKNIINHLFDPSFSMIKKLICYEEVFLNSENKFLEDLNLMRNNEENDEEIFKKILNSKNLKKVDFENNLNIEKIAKLNGINYSMEELSFKNDVLDGDLIFLQDKFPNLKILSIDSNKNEINNVEVLENSKYQLNDITINNLSNIKIYCKSYYRLTKCYLSFSK